MSTRSPKLLLIASLISLFTALICDQQIVAQNQSSPANAGKPPTIYWPAKVSSNAQIITPKQFFGFEIGHRHLRHDQVVAYMRTLAEASDRVTITEYGKTHGGRPLVMLTITSPQNHDRIDEIRRQHRQLAKPQAENADDHGDLPVVMNMGYGVHGDEPSATNTAPLVAHYLASATGDEIERTLDQCVVLLDPSLNPDGFDRFARWTNTFRGKNPNSDPAHLEHNQGWPAGRVNYYWFDLNRDWLPAQHPESRGRLRMYHAWKPNVVLDFHEMGTNSTFFFQPGIPQRTNPLTPVRNIELTREIAKFHAKDLDRLGSLYFTQEVFDDFYMGKGSTYPDLHGSVGILFEQGSSRGHIQESANGVLRFSDTIRNQFTASLSSLRAVTELRIDLLDYQRQFYQQSLADADKHKAKTYVFQLPNNRTRLQSFADILLRHDIKCFWLKEQTVVGERVIASGSLVVPARQAEFRFLRSLIERRKKFKESVFYDVSAWTLPLAFNLKQINLRADIDQQSLAPCRLGGRPQTELPEAFDKETTVAYFVDWRDDSAPRLLQKLLKNEVMVRVARKPLSAISDGQAVPFSFGTLSVPMGPNKPPRKQKRIRQLLKRAARSGVKITPVESGLAASGIDLGSNNFPTVRPKSVAMIVGRGVSAYQAGQVWHQLDARVGLPVSMLRQDDLATAALERYTTIVFVSGSYDLSENSLQELRRWLSRGGNLIAIGSAVRFAERELAGLSPPAEVMPDPNRNPEVSDPLTQPSKTAPPRFVDARSTAALALVSGAIFETEADITHPLLYGLESKQLPVFRNSTRLLTPATTEVSNPMRYTESPLMAGYASQENQQRIAGTPSVSVHPVGRGRVILMVDDPNFRAFWPATSRVFLNAVFFGEIASAGRGRR